MTKTIETQIEKSRNLIQGLRKHLSEGGMGIDQHQLAAMEQTINALIAACNECDRLRAELVPKVKYMNEVLSRVKDDYVNHKLIIKNHYPQEKWIVYGLTDKR